MLVVAQGNGDPGGLIAGGVIAILIACATVTFRGAFRREMRRGGIGGLFAPPTRHPSESQINGVLQYLIVMGFVFGVLGLSVGLWRLWGS